MVPGGKSNAEMLGLAKPKRATASIPAAVACANCGAIHAVSHQFRPECGTQQ